MACTRMYVSSKEELNNKDVIDAMNSGIDSWSETQNNQILFLVPLKSF